MLQTSRSVTLMYTDMSYTLTAENPDTLISSWIKLQHLRWDNAFILPCWLGTWWREFGADAELYLCAVWQEETIIGIAPLKIKEGIASFIGSVDVCDYLDFVVTPEKEQDFFNIVLDSLRKKDINILDLACLRPDSMTATTLLTMARDRGYEVVFHPEDVSLELDLPATWDEYLEILNPKQRHEVKRKLKRLEEAGDVEYHVIDDIEVIPQAIDIFLKLFCDSREDKACFLTTRRESFFRSLANSMGETGLLKIGLLELNSCYVAAVMCLDYKDSIYLYNSGYDPRYSSLSVGLISKILCIKDSIQREKKVFDFMRGAEVYKYRLGGKEIPIYRSKIILA